MHVLWTTFSVERMKIFLFIDSDYISVQVDICDSSPIKASTVIFPEDCIFIIKTYVYIVSNPDTVLSMHVYSGAFEVELSAGPPATQNSSYILVGGGSELNMIISLQNQACRNIFNSQTKTKSFSCWCSALLRGPAAMSNLIVFHSPKHGQSDWYMKRQGSTLNELWRQRWIELALFQYSQVLMRIII